MHPVRASPAELVPAQLQDDDQGLADDPPGHLRLAHPPVTERDRHLPDPRPQPARPEGHLDLEDVAPGVDAVERDPGQRLGAPGLEATGEVVRGETQYEPGEEAAAPRDHPPGKPPVNDAATGTCLLYTSDAADEEDSVD